MLTAIQRGIDWCPAWAWLTPCLLPLGVTAVLAQTPPQEPPAESKQVGSVQIGVNQSRLTNNNGSWHDVSARGNVSLGDEVGVLNWEASQQKHFGETGQALSISLTRDLSPRWYASVGVGGGASANFLTKRRLDVAIYRKWLEQSQWVTGVQFTRSSSGDGLYRDQAWQLSSSYYFDFPLVAELGLKRTTSNPGRVNTMRYYAAATYGENKKYYLSARYDKGREGYMPIAVPGAAVNFPSRVVTTTWRQWVTSDAGYELQAEYYKNPFYSRTGLGASVFYDF
jgi:YaiO family outer membrane protein